MTRAIARVAVLAVVVAVTGLGCDGSGNDTTSASTVPAVDPARVSPSDLVTVPPLADGEGAVADVTFGACPTEAGAHDVTATVRNSSSAPRDYVITVSWVNATFDVLARAVAVVEQAPPGEEVPAELGATVPDGAADCTFHVTAGTLD